jgi:hypothetical protein
MRILHIRREQICFKDSKNIKLLFVLSKPLYNLPFDFFEILSLYLHQARLNVKLSLCVFLFPYAYMENTRKESLRIWRMREKNLCTWRKCIKNLYLQGECAKRIYAYMENAGKESMRTWRKHKIVIIFRHILT